MKLTQRTAVSRRGLSALSIGAVCWLAVAAHGQGPDLATPDRPAPAVALPRGLTLPRPGIESVGVPVIGAEEKKAAVLLEDGKALPLKAPPAAPPPPPPLPNLPPGATMGGLPSTPPATEATPSSLQQFIRDNLSVRLRGGGLIRPYGFARTDLDFASNRFNDIQNPFFVLPQNRGFVAGLNAVPVGHDANYSLYPRLTRLGVEYFGPQHDADALRLLGRVEVDFLTSNPGGLVPNSESRELLRLRLAYAQVQHNGFTLVVGQDWDLVSPLNPTINDNTLMWYAGNLGDRRAQVKFLYDHPLSDGVTLQVQNGMWLADAITNQDLDGNGLRDAEDGTIPGYQGRLGLVADSWVPGEKALGGVWGALATSRTRVPIGLSGRDRFRTQMIGMDLRVPVVKGLTFQGELWYGKDLDDLRGGIGQGVNPFLGREVASWGGWCELVGRPCPWYQPALGITTDDPVNGDVVGVSIGPNRNAGRTNNLTWYLSNRFFVTDGVVVGLDYMSWATGWAGYGRAHASMVKCFAQLNF